MSRPLIFMDPFPRTPEMVLTAETKAELEALGRLVTHFGGRAPDNLVDEHLEDIDILIGQSAMPRERLERARNLKAIINVKANWEPSIDYDYAQARGVCVLTAAPAMAVAVAEAALGFAIDLARRTHQAHDQFREGTEGYGIRGNIDSYSLFDADIGFVGFGNLGRCLLPLLKPFSPRIRVFDPWLSDGYLKSQGLIPTGIDEVMASSRFLFILAGTTTENEGFVNRRLLELLPHDASVILVSRAEVVDFQALLEMGASGHLRVAIDVYPEEPVAKDDPMRELPNILFSSHRSGGIWDSYRRIRDWMVEDIRQILQGHPPLRLQRAEPRQAAISMSR